MTKPMFKQPATVQNAPVQNGRPNANSRTIYGYINIAVPRKNGTTMRLPSSNISSDLAVGKDLHDWLMEDPKNVETLINKMVVTYQPNSSTNDLEDLDLF